MPASDSHLGLGRAPYNANPALSLQTLTLKKKLISGAYNTEKGDLFRNLANFQRYDIAARDSHLGLDIAARDSHLGLSRPPYALHGVKYIDVVSLAPFAGTR